MQKIKVLFLVVLGFILLTSCVKAVVVPSDEDKQGDNDYEEGLVNLKVPLGFDFSTQKDIKVIINDNTAGVKYDVYAYNEQSFTGEEYVFINDEDAEETGVEFRTDILNHFLFNGIPFSGKLEHLITIPSYYEKIYIRRNDNNVFSSVVVDFSSGEAIYTYVASTSGKYGKSAKKSVEDYLFCVNGSGELFQVDPLTGDYTAISDMPMGSYTAAIDQENKVLYSIGRSSPNPLMKYSIENDSWTTVANLFIGGPRLDYNSTDNLLYFSKGSLLYSIDPVNGTILSTWEIIGLDSASGGDLAFAEDGTLFMCTFSGLYRLDLNNDDEYQSTRISADMLPFKPTSMTFDSNQELWLAHTGSNADLIIMDTETGGWQYNFGLSANNDTEIGRTINDLTTYRIFDENAVEVDTDGDGIIDSKDIYPDDAEKAFELFTPSKYGWGTVAFEDLWPAIGDYDFNDVAVNYKVVAIQNSENKVVQVDFNILVKANGASFKNAFGIELENLVPSQIESVTGTVLTQGYINLNANGTEAGQENVVVILYDNNYTMLNTPITVSVKFTTPITTDELGVAPFNPFMIVDSTREREVHLPYAHTTSLGVKNLELEEVNKDPDGNYVTETGLPWAINIIHDFKTPTEKTSIDDAYNFFNDWVASGGATHSDWYKDGEGYRNPSKLSD